MDVLASTTGFADPFGVCRWQKCADHTQGLSHSDQSSGTQAGSAFRDTNSEVRCCLGARLGLIPP